MQLPAHSLLISVLLSGRRGTVAARQDAAGRKCSNRHGHAGYEREQQADREAGGRAGRREGRQEFKREEM